jgi:hypothetical protein
MQAIRGRDGILEIKKSMLEKTLLNSSVTLNKHTVTDKKGKQRGLLHNTEPLFPEQA